MFKIIFYIPKLNYIPFNTDWFTGLQSFVVEKLWVGPGVIFNVESESGIRIRLSRQDFQIFEVMCSKSSCVHYIWGYVQGARNFFVYFSQMSSFSTTLFEWF